MTLRRFAATVLATLLTAACSSTATRVVLLPQADGRPSAVVVRANDGEEVLAKPYQRATVARGATGAPVVDQADPARIQAENRSLFELIPPAAQRYTLYFDSGGILITETSLTTLREALAAAASRDGGEILLVGYTDTKGSAEQNDALSRQRAREVRQLLIDRGFPAGRIQAVGRGERNLAVQTADDVEEPRNRRVLVEVR